MIYLNEELCKGCFLCVNVCPKNVYTPSDVINHKGVKVPIFDVDKCIKCRLCTLMCPDQAIDIEDDD
ncbi:MAG: 4Fe-4S dicluster domain-containing protein [Methanosphaera stadtmanae]|nr:4Fe-4S dicluster domain-containing protein [Methanosphaera stadtmanae]